MDRQMETLRYPAYSASGLRRRQVRRLPFTTQLVDVGDLQIDLDPIEVLADLDPGFLPLPEGAGTAV